MTKETDYQASLCDAAKEMGGYGQKLTNAFIVGIPDLLIQIPNWPTTLIEVKRQLIKPGTKVVSVNLTAMQHDKIDRHQKAGGTAGWLMIAHTPNGEKWIMASSELPHVAGDAVKFSSEVYSGQACHMRRSDPWVKALRYAMVQINHSECR